MDEFELLLGEGFACMLLPAESGNKKTLTKSGSYPWQFGQAIAGLAQRHGPRMYNAAISLEAYRV